MTRIIAGSAGGRRIAVPRRGTRPTSARLRESIFASLGSDREWSGLAVLDVFAGSGALALEALSRGCATATIVESGRRAAATCRENAAALGFGDCVTVVTEDAFRWLRRSPDAAFDLVFVDPPYGMSADRVDGLMGLLVECGSLACGARVVVERPRRSRTVSWQTGFADVVSRVVGDTVVHRAVWRAAGVNGS